MTSTPPKVEVAETDEVPLLEIATFLLRHRRLIVGSAGLLSVVVVVVLSFGRTRYTSSASFVPRSSSQVSALAGVAAQFGVIAPGTDAAESPAFYADLLKSRELLTTILQGEYRVSADSSTESRKLIDLLRVKGSTDGRRMSKAITKLTRSLRVDLRTRTGVVAFEVRMPDPVLAQEVCQRFLDELSRFNMKQRQSRAGAERRFTAGRIAELQVELRDAEDRLQAFLQRNRDYRHSPELTFQYDRMVREVERRQTVYNTVAQANEKARIDEARDTPVITVIDSPSLPARADKRGRVLYGLVAILFGGMAGVGFGFVSDIGPRRRAAAGPEVVAFSLEAKETLVDLGRIPRLVRRVFARRGPASS